MKNLMLVGDSIRMGYDKSIRKSLEGKVNIIATGENCRFASYVLRAFHEYYRPLMGKEIDVIHWNAGLWDTLRLFGEDPHTPIDIYAYYIDRICVRMKKCCPNAKIIFATSTSVLEEKMADDFKRYNKEIQEYNKVAVEIVKKHGFEVNDLYKLSCELPEEARSDAVHFYTTQGTEAFTNQVLAHVLPALGIDEKIVYKDDMYTDAPIGI